MAFDLVLAGSHVSPVPVRKRNPFTGKDIEYFPAILERDELARATAVLVHGSGGRSAESVVAGTTHVVTLPTGARAEVRVGNGSWKVALSEWSAEAAAFVFELASAGDFFVQSDLAAVVTTPAAKARLEASFECTRVHSAGELEAAFRIARAGG